MSIVYFGMPVAAPAGAMELPADADPLAILDLLGHGARDRNTAVVVPADVGTGHPRMAQVAHALRRHPDVALVRLPGPLTAAACVGWMLSGAGALPAHDVVAVADRALAHVTSAAAVRSVTKLRDPTPSLGQHAASWLPWTRFGIHLPARSIAEEPNSASRGISHQRRVGPSRTLPERVEGVAVSFGAANDRALAGVLPLPEEGAAVDPALVGNYWRTKKFAERSYLQADPNELLQHATGRRPACVNCERPSWRTICPFCGARLIPDDRRIPA